MFTVYNPNVYIVLQLVFVDTEGFESTGRADAYDDRIFALSTLISSVLVYNLPESIRESDVEKLSFAAELANAFYADSLAAGNATQSDGTSSLGMRPGAMIWLIQRDFLRGESLESALRTALRQVPNPHNDPAITQLNNIRKGLSAIAANSTALGLPQPHIDRTRLCEIPDDQLDPDYLRKREELKLAVHIAARPKVVRGAVMDGPALADFITEVVTALNEKEIPTAGSLVRYFNRELVDACREQFIAALERQILPMEATALQVAAATARAAARDKYERGRFGAAVEELDRALEAALDRELAAFTTTNTYQSSVACDAAELECEAELEREAGHRLPSTGRFSSRFNKCKGRFDSVCVGPAKEHAEARLTRVWERESSRFEREYNDRLYNGLILISVVLIVVTRFVLKWSIGETAAWASFIFLQIYPKSFLGSGSSMFETSGWQGLVKVWEVVVDNPIVDLESFGLPVGCVAILGFMTRRKWAWRLGCCSLRKGPKRSKTHKDRDLDV